MVPPVPDADVDAGHTVGPIRRHAPGTDMSADDERYGVSAGCEHDPQPLSGHRLAGASTYRRVIYADCARCGRRWTSWGELLTLPTGGLRPCVAPLPRPSGMIP